MLRVFAPNSTRLKVLVALSVCMGIGVAPISAQEASKPASEIKIPEWYAKKTADLGNPSTPLGGMLQKVESWLDLAEANPAATVSIPPANLQDKNTKPTIYPARQLAEQGALRLRQQFGNSPQDVVAASDSSIGPTHIPILPAPQ